jgi:hypothetical protein
VPARPGVNGGAKPGNACDAPLTERVDATYDGLFTSNKA